MARATKGELRAYMRRVREDLVNLNKALSADQPHHVQVHISDMLGCMEEIAGLAENRYDLDTIECAAVGPCTTPSDDDYEDEDEEFDDEDEDECE